MSRKKSQNPVIIYRLGSLGDTVIAMPCFHHVARTFPDRERIVLTNKPVSGVAPALEAILGSSGLVHSYITYDVGERGFFDLLNLFLRIRASGADTMVYLTAGRGLENVARDMRFFRLCGIKKFHGAPSTADLHENRLVGSDDREIEPEAERLVRTLESLGPIDLRDRANWDLLLNEYEHAAAERAIAALQGQPFIAISIGTKLPANDWGKDNWNAMLSVLAARLENVALVGIGASADFAGTERLLRRWKGKTANLCGTLDPRQSAAVLSRAALFIGHDSGPMHLAAASGAPTIGVFGNNNPPRKWHPYGDRCLAIQDMRGVTNIPVEKVVVSAIEFLDYSHV